MGAALGAVLLLGSGYDRAAAACNLPPLGQGHVAAVIDERTFRLDDGREIRLAGIEALSSLRETTPNAGSATRPDIAVLTSLVGDRDVTLRGPAAKPDRYGRLVAFAYAGASVDSIQGLLLDRGDAAVAGNIGGTENRECVNELLVHEATARRARRGFWAEPTAIKNTENAADISPWIGRFVVAEGKIASVHEAAGTVYINFGGHWTRDFAVTISGRMIHTFEGAGINPKTLENRTVRVRGWVELRGGPRIEALGPGQIELVGDR